MSDIENIKKLRNLTNAGFKDCSAALKESSGDVEKAVEILRVKGISKASKKMSREANEGLIAISGDKKQYSIIEINCETDFVGKNDDFIKFVKELSELNNSVKSNLDKLMKLSMKNNQTVEENIVNLISTVGEKITIGRSKTIENKNSNLYKYHHTVVKDNVSKLGVIVSIDSNESTEALEIFGKQLSMHIAASNPIAVTENDIEEGILKKEEILIAEELKNSGKSKDIIKKISIGKIKKFKEENSLLDQDWVMEPKKKVKDVMTDLKVSNIKIKEFIRLKIGD
tara:strand:+ start:2379 stop:3230 length:852 start_codon:yes stop_codon:yes gene_type:complete